MKLYIVVYVAVRSLRTEGTIDEMVLECVGPFGLPSRPNNFVFVLLRYPRVGVGMRPDVGVASFASSRRPLAGECTLPA